MLQLFKIKSGMRFENQDGSGIDLRQGSGTPENVVAAGIGSLYLDYTNGRVYIKESGNGNTGWNVLQSQNNILQFKQSVRLATAAALPACTASGAGVGKTLTGNVNGALSIDGITVAEGDRVLIKNENGNLADVNNGIYIVTAVGDASNPFVLTRALDADQDSEVKAGMFCFVEEGNTFAETQWVLATDNAIVVDTTPLQFTQFAGSNLYRAADGIAIDASRNISVRLDAASGLEFNAGNIRANVDATNGSTEINAANEIAVRGYAKKSLINQANGTIIDSFAMAQGTIKWFAEVSQNGTPANRYACEVLAVVEGANADFNETGILELGSKQHVRFDVQKNAGNVELRVYADANYDVTFTRILIN